MMMNTLNHFFYRAAGYLLRISILPAILLLTHPSFAITRVSVSGGTFNQATTWNPAGVPATGDELTIQNGHVISVSNNAVAGKLTIANGGKLTFTPASRLTVSGDFIVYGRAEIMEADFNLSTPGAAFIIGATGTVVWEPRDNTLAGATLFTNGTELFHPASTLIINRWYNYSGVPLGSVVTGNFGNLTLSTLTNGLLFEWNQDNEFETHAIQGTLTVNQGWIVLDKSGSISNTTIGAIELNNYNSYLDLHSGNHPGSFTVTTSGITNNGGNLNGLYNGNGNVKLQVNGNFTNLGNSVLIYNSGVMGVSNGNASMDVTGKYYQSSGDFRGIFNLTSVTSGKSDLEFNQMHLTGGIFMGHYACHSGGNVSNLKIHGDLLIDFATASSKFRGNGLTTLSGTSNNAGLNFTVEGNLTVKGTTAAEFTSSGSTGPETIVFKGTVGFEGCTANFNFGSHSTTLSIYEDAVIAGGLVYLSRTDGSLTAVLQKNLEVQYGNLTVTAGTGNCNLAVNGDYYQTGGSFFLHNNNTVATSNIVYVTIMGDFLNQSGIISFDNNNTSTVQHHLSINGEKFTLGGNASIATTTSVSAPRFGIVYYDRMGPMEYHHHGNDITIHNTKQVINTGCTLKIKTGDLQVSESNQSVNDMLLITGNSILDAGAGQIYGNPSNVHTSVRVEDYGRLRISQAHGLYNGAATAAIRASGNMIFTLDPKSIVEYYGSNDQVVTGTGIGTANSTNQQYGTLEINKSGSSAKLNSNSVITRSGLFLKEGELDLNGFNMTLNSGLPNALLSANGYIRSEPEADGTTGMVRWKNIAAGEHIIPFGISEDKMLPFHFTPVSGYGNEFAVSTRSCNADNRPLGTGVTNLEYQGQDAGEKKIIDRWFNIAASNITASIMATYLPEENTLDPNISKENLSFIGWYDSKWSLIGGSGTGTLHTSGTVTSGNINRWGNFLIASNKNLPPADLLSFKAVLNEKQVDLNWEAKTNSNAVKYIVERSDDEFNFSDLSHANALPPSTSALIYDAVDLAPLTGTSWYRIRQQQRDGSLKYSNSIRIENNPGQLHGVQILSVNPNPFSSGFTASYQVPVTGDVAIRLTGSNGQSVYNTILLQESGKNSFLFDAGENLTPGLYILSISNGKSSKNIKLFHI